MMLILGTATHAGLKRKDHPNQDFFGSCLPGTINLRPPLLVVADGMGGYNGGEIASQLVVKTITEQYLHYIYPKEVNYAYIIKDAILKAHKAVLNYAVQHEALAQMGSTVVVVLVDKNQLYLGNVGDSRAYLINHTEIRHINHDHSFVADLVRSGVITLEESLKHPKRNVLSMSISAQRPVIDPFITQMPVNPGEDYILLCSDGLWGVVPEAEIQNVVLTMAPQAAAERLVDLANQNQGPDNITVMVAKVEKDKPGLADWFLSPFKGTPGK